MSEGPSRYQQVSNMSLGGTDQIPKRFGTPHFPNRCMFRVNTDIVRHEAP